MPTFKAVEISSTEHADTLFRAIYSVFGSVPRHLPDIDSLMFDKADPWRLDPHTREEAVFTTRHTGREVRLAFVDFPKDGTLQKATIYFKNEASTNAAAQIMENLPAGTVIEVKLDNGAIVDREHFISLLRMDAGRQTSNQHSWLHS